MLCKAVFGALDGHRPQIAESAFVAPATVVVGRVRISACSSVRYGSVLRGDDEEIVKRLEHQAKGPRHYTVRCSVVRLRKDVSFQYRH